MSESFDHFTGEVILQATMEVKPGKINHVLHYLREIKEYSDSPQEPGCMTFRICHSGNSILIFEKYTDKEAVKAHFNIPPFESFQADAMPFLETFKFTYFEEGAHTL